MKISAFAALTQSLAVVAIILQLHRHTQPVFTLSRDATGREERV